jgi:hypothetical protein
MFLQTWSTSMLQFNEDHASLVASLPSRFRRRHCVFFGYDRVMIKGVFSSFSTNFLRLQLLMSEFTLFQQVQLWTISARHVVREDLALGELGQGTARGAGDERCRCNMKQKSGACCRPGTRMQTCDKLATVFDQTIELRLMYLSHATKIACRCKNLVCGRLTVKFPHNNLYQLWTPYY